MNTQLSTMPGYRYAEYLLVLNPHEDLRNRIIKQKKEFHDAYQTPYALWGKPHITLAKFTVWQMMEEKIVNRLNIAAMGSPPFKVLLKDYGSFPSHTIFMNITTKLPIQNLIKAVRSSKRLMKSPDFEPFFIMEPHLTIARKLEPAQYEKAWLEYAHKSFTGNFIADGMLLIKRLQGDKAYQIVRRFEFKNLPVSTKQGELFG